MRGVSDEGLLESALAPVENRQRLKLRDAGRKLEQFQVAVRN
jgi:hypothetical protein